jgi:hypothetical protein
LVTGAAGEKDRPLSSLPQDIQAIIRALEHLHEKDRRIVLTLASSLKNR